MRQPMILDNKTNGKVVDVLKKYLHSGSRLSVISAYFSIYAFAELKEELSAVNSFRLILTNPAFAEKPKESKEFYIEHAGQTARKEPDFTGSEYEIRLRNEMKQAAVAKECASWLRKKGEVKVFRHENLAQPRSISLECGEDSLNINGTVDFTPDGLGIVSSDRADSNVCMFGQEATQAFVRQFDLFWNNGDVATDIKDKLLERLEVLYKENPPEFMYFVTLYNVFYQYLGELSEDNILKSKTGIKDTLIWKKLYTFQKDGVIGAIDKIEKYNGCIIADSVGLGKTFEALAIIKYYQLRNDRVLVICPKRLRDNWTIYTMNDTRNLFAGDRFNYDVLNHTDLNRYTGTSGEINLATLNWSGYDLVVIDESHNFRNNNPVKGKVTRYERLMNDIIKAGVPTKVLMLSATPVNSRMTDIKNQIAFITEGNNTALAKVGLPNIDLILRKAQKSYNSWLKNPDDTRTTSTFVDMMDIDYFKLLDTLTIARSRKHIQKYYNMAEIGKFPERNKPVNCYPSIDTKDEFPLISEINRCIKHLTLGLYAPLSYVLPEKRAVYDSQYDMELHDGTSIFKQADREQSLIGLIRVDLLKRMESSIYSFALTVERIVAATEKQIASIDTHEHDYDPDLNIAEIDPDDTDLGDLLLGKKIKVLLQDLDLIRFRQDLERDLEQLETMLSAARKVTPERDCKMLELKNRIKQKIEHPYNSGNRKILVFTAFADTANYLYDNLSRPLLEHGLYSAVVSGSSCNRSTLRVSKEEAKTIRISDLNTVLTLFSPVSKEGHKIFPDMKQEIDVIFATDCISEGQNLQDCDYLVNYDIHWNPVRIIQRFGRIDRIGSRNDCVQLVNFWPMKDLDEYINLCQRVQGRMVLLDVSATGEENIISEDDQKEMQDLAYRRRQLEELRDEVVDLEDVNGGISITDLTFNDFKTDLMGYLKDHREELARAPSGMYAVASIDDTDNGTVEPGVIFTLRQVRGVVQTREQNPLYPYYLLYVTQNGDVQLTYLHARQILAMYKKVCAGQNRVLPELVAQFDRETGNGHHMKAYSALLEKAISILKEKKQETGIKSLFSKGGTQLQKSGYAGSEDFELVSFLVLRRNTCE
ncbi:MAG: SNF2-related protein [Treponema sp.]|nr:SNF2-related protein [Treponema sp.]